MASVFRPGGKLFGIWRVQFVPSQVHVSAMFPPLARFDPPNKTAWPWAESKTIASSARGVGLVAGDCPVQLAPSHNQVSFNCAVESDPPNNTAWPRVES